MMIQAKKVSSIKDEQTNLVLGIFTDQLPALFTELDGILEGNLTLMLEQGLIQKKYQEVTPIFTFGKLKCPKIYVVSMGEVADFDLGKYRRTIGKVAQAVKEDVTFLIETFANGEFSVCKLARIAAESITLATFKVDCYKSDKPESTPINFYLHAETDVDDAIEKGIIYGQGANHARALVNKPGNKLTATDLADSVSKFAQEHQLECNIIEKDEMIQKGMGGILGVNRGSTEPPKMIVAKYQGTAQFDNVTALIGKGLTFDTGGYNLKPSQAIYGMHGDMGGAASAIGAFETAVRLKLPVNLLLVVPATDNMISGDSIKPGDVLHTMSGKTVEVVNTDAEGRLILADALTLAQELGASRMINLATLTGAMVVALGMDTTGAFTNDQEFLNDFLRASKDAHEDVWQMPLYKRDQEALKASLVADLNNAPAKKPGAIMAAAFLKEFALDTPWIHLDVAGTAGTEAAHDLGPKGGTGVMVRTIVNYLENNFKG